MKNMHVSRTLALLLALALVFACALPAWAEDSGTHTVAERGYKTYLGVTPDDTLNEEFPLYFADGVDDLPYVDIGDWVDLMNFYHTDAGDAGYELKIDADNDVVTLTRENGYTATLDYENDKIVFSDYDAFMHGSDDSTLIDIVSEKSTDDNGRPLLIMRDTKSSFDRYGDMLTIDLGAYDIHMLVVDNRLYVPLQTLNDVMLLPAQVSLIFNGAALFLGSDSMFYDYGAGEYTQMADIFYDVPTKDRSSALAKYSYNELCMALDCFYGLKQVHDIDSFRRLFWQIGFDEALSGPDPMDADNALKELIDYYFDDLHSVFLEYSPMAGMNGISASTGIANRKLEQHRTDFMAARDKAYPDGWLQYEEVGNTAYITFDSFRSDYIAQSFYDAKESGDMPDDTIGQIIEAHAQITREGSPIENVVLDMSCNTGGAVDAAAVVLGWFLGDAPLAVKNMSTGAMSNAIYRADVNLDGSFDEKDTVADKNLYCLISPVSFSCGNLVPAALKSSGKVTLLGQTSGGGSCIVQPMTTAYGTLFQISAPQRMSFLKNGSFYDIDQGIAPDIHIGRLSSFYDRAALTEFINAQP
ncbi:MAG: hypothetical protein IJQ36_02870 [Oscillospiraceae bacterium]|nr:hypothetical protein [Oscillospiraceae bacterium]